jgi:hypothetical protein
MPFGTTTCEPLGYHYCYNNPTQKVPERVIVDPEFVADLDEVQPACDEELVCRNCLWAGELLGYYIQGGGGAS